MAEPAPFFKPHADPAAAWRRRSAELAAWAWDALCNRRDCWGAYWPLGVRAERGNSWTAPARSKRGQVYLTHAVLTRHFAGRDVSHLVGLHSTSPENTSRWAAVDVDCHEGGRADPAANLAAALAWYGRLRGLGFTPLLTDSNGAGGYHLLALFSEPAPTSTVYAFLQWLTDDYRDRGLAARPETYPKQASILPGKYGNWLRVPGRHHSRDHWSRAWDGERWLEGEAAVAFILSLRGSPPSLLPDLPPPPERPARQAPARLVVPPGDQLARRIAGYLRRFPRLGAGEGRSKAAFNLASFLVRDLALSDEAALPWMLAWDEGNVPPLGEADLRDELRCAREYGRNAIGCGLGPRLRPGHSIIRAAVEF